ncbi:MAG: sigma-70 family RNA polymerase sigma factor [Planctomycetota bacterium]
MKVTWDEFVATHASTVLTAALRVVANSADADEVSQEVFLEIYRAGDFALLHTQGALVRTMATRRALDRLRRLKPVVQLTDTEPARDGFEPYQYLIANELDGQLRSSLSQLPPREAEVFCLVYYEGHSPAAVAHLLGISTGAVSKALCKARERLAVTFGCSESESYR